MTSRQGWGRRFAAALTPLSFLLAATTARAEDPDPWLGRDKALHFTACALISGGSYGVAALATGDVRVRVGVGAGAGIAAGVAKEAWDLTGRGDASFRDLTWDLAGTVTGVAVAALIDWAVGKLSADRAVRAR